MESCREVLLTPFLTILLKLMELDDLTANDELGYTHFFIKINKLQETNSSLNTVL